MEQRLNLVTLGVRNVNKSRAFYEGLGWKAGSQSSDEVAFFNVGLTAICLFSKKDLTRDLGIEPASTEPDEALSEPNPKRVKADDAVEKKPISSFEAPLITLSYNVASEADVEPTFEQVIAHGGRAVSKPKKADWGGFSGYFADPDGYYWEISYNPFNPLDEKGFTKYE